MTRKNRDPWKVTATEEEEGTKQSSGKRDDRYVSYGEEPSESEIRQMQRRQGSLKPRKPKKR